LEPTLVFCWVFLISSCRIERKWMTWISTIAFQIMVLTIMVKVPFLLFLHTISFSYPKDKLLTCNRHKWGSLEVFTSLISNEVITNDPNIKKLDNFKVKRHLSFLLRIKIKQPYSTSLSLSLSLFLSLPLYLSLFLSLSLSLSLSLPLSLSPSLSLSLSLYISISLTDWLNEEHSEHARTFCLVTVCSKSSSFIHSVSQHASLYYMY